MSEEFGAKYWPKEFEILESRSQNTEWGCILKGILDSDFWVLSITRYQDQFIKSGFGRIQGEFVFVFHFLSE